MALIKGKLIDPSTAIKQSSDPVSAEDLARKSYVDGKAEAEADAAEQAAKSYADQKVADLVNGAPAMLDTLKELADALEAGDTELSQEILTQVGAVDDRVDQEISDRQAAVSAEQSAREFADQQLQSEIDAEEIARQSGDTALGVRIDGVESDLAQEVSDRQAAVTAEEQARISAVSTEKSERETADAAETAARQAADTAEAAVRAAADEDLQGQIDVVESNLAQEIMDRQSAISSEQQARQAADSELDGRLDVLEADPTTKSYVDTEISGAKSYTDQKVADLVNGAPAMLDTLKELADAIETSSGSLTQDILTQVGAVDDKIDQEISDRQAAVSAEQSARETADQGLQSEIDAVESGLAQEIIDRQTAVSNEASQRESGDNAIWTRIDEIEGNISQEILDRQSADSTEAAARQSGDQFLSNSLNQEISDRNAAVSAEQQRAQNAESNLQSQITQEVSNRQAAVSSEQSRAEAAESALDTRIDALEAAPSPKGRKEVKTMSASDISNAYVDMAEEAMPNTMFVSVSGTVQYEGEDYTVSTVSGKSRVTFIGDLTPDGNGAALVEGEKVYCQYLVMSTSEQQVSGGGSSGGGSSGGGGGGSVPPPPSYTTSLDVNVSSAAKQDSPYAYNSGWGVVDLKVFITGTAPQSFYDAGIMVYGSFNGGSTWSYQDTLQVLSQQYVPFNLGGQPMYVKFVTSEGETTPVLINNF